VLEPTIMAGSTPSMTSGLPPLPIALIRPFLTPMSAYALGRTQTFSDCYRCGLKGGARLTL
jgi:hypothetical protein